jgi:ADP-ribose pyrophosphatase
VIITDKDVELRDGIIWVTNQAWRGHAVSLADAETVQTEVLLEQPKRFIRERLRMPDGEEVDWCYVDTPASVLAIPVMESGDLVMVYQYRHNLRRYTLEFPAGEVAPGEDLEKAALRELAEETGYTPTGEGCVRPLGSFYSSPSETTKETHVFLVSPVIPAGKASKDDQIEKFFNMSVLSTTPEGLMRQISQSDAGSETIAAFMLARPQLAGGAGCR